MKNQLFEDLRRSQLSEEAIFQKFFVSGETFFFDKIWQNKDDEWNLKSSIAKALSVSINEIYIVGSSKTGFSMNPQKMGFSFDESYLKSGEEKDKSDIDVAIVSEPLFDNLANLLFRYTRQYREKWVENHIYRKDKFDVPLCFKFLEYLAKGWFRPDMKPIGFNYPDSQKPIEHDLRVWKNHFSRKVSHAVYRNWFYFREYHLLNIVELKSKIISGEIVWHKQTV